MIVAFFTSDYCPTCEDVERVWNTFKRMHREEAAFIKIKLADDTKDMFSRLGISWVPAVVFYEEDKELRRVEGSFTLLDLERVFRAVLRKREALQTTR